MECCMLLFDDKNMCETFDKQIFSQWMKRIRISIHNNNDKHYEARLAIVMIMEPIMSIMQIQLISIIYNHNCDSTGFYCFTLLLRRKKNIFFYHG